MTNSIFFTNKFRMLTVLVKPLAILTLATIVALGAISSNPHKVEAHADVEDFSILIVMHRVDGTGDFDEEPDFWAGMSIDGVASPHTFIIEDHRHIEPNWTYERGLSSSQLIGSRVPLDIRLREDDSGLRGSDDKVDITPERGPDLHLMAHFTDPNSSSFPYGGYLINRDTGERLAVFQPVRDAYGETILWESTPLVAAGRTRPGAYLVSKGTSKDESARIEYKILILRQPDFVVTNIVSRVNTVEVHIRNLGGPGVVTEVSCWAPGAVSNSVNIVLARNESAVVSVSFSFWYRCGVSGSNLFGRAEKHTDNNSRLH